MVTIVSLFRNDADRNLVSRLNHLLSKKSEHRLSWLWAVGDSDDNTWYMLNTAAKLARKQGHDVKVITANTDVVGDTNDDRRLRAATTANAAFREIPKGADYALLHESDLVSPEDVVDRLLGSGGGQPCAGWPIIHLADGAQFYDTYAYVRMDGRNFTANQMRPLTPFRVLSFGSVWIAPIALVRDVQMGKGAIRDLCAKWVADGVPLWCAPAVEIVQPAELWEAR